LFCDDFGGIFEFDKSVVVVDDVVDGSMEA
jgi:hypothetical protein